MNRILAANEQGENHAGEKAADMCHIIDAPIDCLPIVLILRWHKTMRTCISLQLGRICALYQECLRQIIF